jgi:glycosyltransferase involved in cell wall biosynthesis/peptidoglycan/xylan/chitin deacetylase (PgdA/CDA1 family)
MQLKALAYQMVRYSGGNAIFRLWNRGRIKALIYHNVLPETSAFPFALHPDEFEKHLEAIKKYYNAVSLNEDGEISGMRGDRINVLLTFDDGFINNYEHVFPLLVKHGVKATFFLILSCAKDGAVPRIADRYTGEDSAPCEKLYKTLSLKEIREMRAAGMTFGSHTFEHVDLSKLSVEEAVKEASDSAKVLCELIGAPPTLFAFPWGRYKIAQPFAMAKLFRRVFTTNHGFNSADDRIMHRNEAMTVPHLHAGLSGALGFLKRERSYFSSVGEQAIKFSANGPLITFVLPSMGIGGAEIVNACLARELMKRGFRVEFVVGRHDSEASKVLPPGAGYVVVGAKNNRGFLLPLISYLLGRRPKIFVGSMWSLTATVALAHSLSGSRAKLCLWEHSTLSVQYGHRKPPHNFLLKTSLRWALGKADTRIAVSGGVADDLAVLTDLPRDQFEVIYNPIYLAPTDHDADHEAENLWRGWRGPRIITVGNCKAQKNHALLLEAFKQFLAVREARLLILGTGVLFERTAALASSLGIADKVLLPGVRPNPAAYYERADLFVLSSNFEGFGNVIVEALSCGVPVVSTDCRSGPAEILENGRYGMLVPVGDAEALARAMLDSLDSTHDKEALKRRAAEFSPERMADQFLRAVYPKSTKEHTSGFAAARR